MGTNYYAVPNRPSINGGVHIGKASVGWMFLFHEQENTWSDPPIEWHTYEQVRDWLWKHTVQKNDFVIMNEYDEMCSYEALFELIDRQQEVFKDNPENFKYNKNVNGYRFSDHEFC